MERSYIGLYVVTACTNRDRNARIIDMKQKLNLVRLDLTNELLFTEVVKISTTSTLAVLF